jgi:Domain of unknown function (DUF5666)
MRPLFAASLVTLALWIAAAPAQAQSRVRGTITAVDATTLSLKTRGGEDLQMRIAENATVAVATAVKFEDIKAGDYVGSAAVKRADGMLVALEVHYLAPTVPQGHMPWDLQPGSTMTNANVDAVVVASGNRSLTLKYKDGAQTIIVPEGVPIVRAIAGTRADLKPGEYVFVSTQPGDGPPTALRIQVSKDGVRPPQ